MEASYERRVMEEVLTYQARNTVRVQCPDNDEYMAVGLLAVYWKTQHGKDSGEIKQWDIPTLYG